MAIYQQDNDNIEQLYLKIIEENLYILEEMFVIGSPNIESDYNFIAYKSKIWIFPSNFNNTEAGVLEDLLKTFNLTNINIKSFNDLLDSLKPFSVSNYKILTGNVNFDTEIMYLHNNDLFNIKDKNNSTLVKKVGQALSPSKIEYQQYDLDNDGKIFYHGTASIYLKSILRKGLTPDTLNTNFPNIKHLIKGRSFFSSNYNYAYNYAIASAMTTKSRSVVISFKVPSYELLEPDYDIENKFPTDKKGEAFKLSRELGIFAYNGKIFPNHIQSVIIPGNTFYAEPIEVPYTVARQLLNNMNMDTDEFMTRWY